MFNKNKSLDRYGREYGIPNSANVTLLRRVNEPNPLITVVTEEVEWKIESNPKLTKICNEKPKPNSQFPLFSISQTILLLFQKYLLDPQQKIRETLKFVSFKIM